LNQRQRRWLALRRSVASAIGGSLLTTMAVVACIGGAYGAYQTFFASAALDNVVVSGMIRRESAGGEPSAGARRPIPADPLDPGNADSQTPRRAPASRTAGLAAAVGAILAIGFAVGWLRRRRSGALSEPRLGSELPDLPVLARIPHIPDHQMRESAGGIVDSEPYMRALGELGARLHRKAFHAPSVILVTSASAGEGKTAVALNLAAWLARSARVMLVDADLRSAGLSRRLGLPRYDAGLNELISHSAPYRSCLAQTGLRNLHVIRSGTLPRRPEQVLQSSRMAQTLELAKRYYSHIVIDSPSMNEYADAKALARHADAVVLVADAQAGQIGAISRAVELLKSVNANVPGIVINNT
jgi:capsular exopolysaccharide synthesis family protein